MIFARNFTYLDILVLRKADFLLFNPVKRRIVFVSILQEKNEANSSPFSLFLV